MIQFRKRYIICINTFLKSLYRNIFSKSKTFVTKKLGNRVRRKKDNKLIAMAHQTKENNT